MTETEQVQVWVSGLRRAEVRVDEVPANLQLQVRKHLELSRSYSRSVAIPSALAAVILVIIGPGLFDRLPYSETVQSAILFGMVALVSLYALTNAWSWYRDLRLLRNFAD